MRDQVEGAWLYHLIRAYFLAATEKNIAGTPEDVNDKRLQRFDKAMLLTDQFCLGDLVSNASAPASAYR